MISKKELLQKVRELSGVYLSAAAKLDALIEWAESLPDDQPDVLPFQWPIPDGMDVVTRDGRKVEQLIRLDCIEDPIIGVVEGETTSTNWYDDGSFVAGNQHHYDLFLRRKGKKVWVVDYNGVLDFYEDKKEATDHNENVYDGEAKVYQILVKPVV